ncbi:MAG TPA: hypothetical protein VG013_03605 [Gemmataceae bacterium]|jgi:hypothetical protein|nr:hypothetical protein [Gemmataceae bacterium]
MASVQNMPRILDEITDFLASSPSREQLLNYRPSDEVQQRARELLAKLKNGQLTEAENRELDQFESVEMLMQLLKIKARMRDGQVPQR